MKIEDLMDISNIDEIEKMSPEECKGLLKGFFIGFEFMKVIDDGVLKAIDNRHKNIFENYTTIYNPYRSQDRQDFRKIRLTFQDREDAIEVLDDLREELKMSKDYYVSVRTLYSLADLPTNNVMLNWGWYDLEDCEIAREADHYILKMPPVEYIRKKDRASSIS